MNNREKNYNFSKDVFNKKVKQHLDCGYTLELAESKVLGDFNREFFKFMGLSPNKRKTDKEGFYIQ